MKTAIEKAGYTGKVISMGLLSPFYLILYFMETVVLTFITWLGRDWHGCCRFRVLH